MNSLMYLSLAINILVLVPIVILMSIKAKIVDETWGAMSPARGILFSIYFSILVASIALVFLPVPAFVAALLSVQVIYKVTTPFTVGSFKHPVVISNLGISVVHLATLVSIFTEAGFEFVQAA